MATKKRRTTSKKRGSQKRDLVKGRRATHFAKRTSRGRFTEMDERGRSLKSDRRRRSKTRSRAGYGDRGDRAA
jgi:hypothetical protein